MLLDSFRRAHRPSADPPTPPPATAAPPTPADIATLQAALDERDRLIASYEKAAQAAQARERTLENEVTSLQYRNRQLSQRLDEARGIVLTGPAAAAVARTRSDSALIAQQQANLNAQANIIAHLHDELAGRGRVRMGAWA